MADEWAPTMAVGHNCLAEQNGCHESRSLAKVYTGKISILLV